MKIGELIKLEIKRKGLTQKQLAEKTGITTTTINHIIKGINYPRPSTLKKICEVLDIKIEYKVIDTTKGIHDVSNCTGLEPPSFKQKNMALKKERAKYLKSEGYSIRETMRIMGYKSPKSIQDLLK